MGWTKLIKRMIKKVSCDAIFKSIPPNESIKSPLIIQKRKLSNVIFWWKRNLRVINVYAVAAAEAIAHRKYDEKNERRWLMRKDEFLLFFYYIFPLNYFIFAPVTRAPREREWERNQCRDRIRSISSAKLNVRWRNEKNKRSKKSLNEKIMIMMFVLSFLCRFCLRLHPNITLEPWRRALIGREIAEMRN